MNTSDLKVLMISSDRNIFTPGSAVVERMKEYGALVKELHIVVLSDKSHGLKNAQLAKNVWAYPTNSFFKFFRPLDAARIGKKIVFDRKFIRGQSVITAQDPFECGWAGLKIKKKWRLPLEVQLHTDPFSPYFSGFLNSVRKRIARRVLKQADSLRVVSEYLKLKAKSYNLKAGISVLPIYVDKERIESAPISFDVHARFGWHFILLSVARLNPEKNLGLALQILALVRTRFPNTGLVIVGSGPEEGKLKALAKKLGVEKNVAFEGWQENLASYYKTSNAFLQTSVFEGYGMALVEAGLSGLPIITTPVGIANDLIGGKNAYIYPAENPRLFAQGIFDLIEHSDRREILRLNIKRALEEMLLPKDTYLRELKKNWEETAAAISKS